MSRVARDIYRKRLRHALAITGDEAFLQMTWALDALQTGREDLAARTLRFPEAAATKDIASPYAIHAWELETLVNQLLLTPKAFGPKTYLCDNFDIAAVFNNFLRKLENAESSLYLHKINILNEVHRIGQRQFSWQRGYLNKADFYRPIYLFGLGECAAYFERTYGISIERFTLAGFGLFSQLVKAPYTGRDLDLAQVGLSKAEFDTALVLLAIGGDRAAVELKELIRKAGGAALPTAYQPSILRRFPVLAFGRNGERLRAPIPALILQRITTGLYYDLVAGKAGLRNEVADRFEGYCADFISATMPALAVSRSYKYRGPRRAGDFDTPDILIRRDDQLLLAIECKSTKLTFAAQFDEEPAQAAATGYAELGKGVFQIWRFFSHCRRGLVNEAMRDDVRGIVLTLDTWLVASRELQDHVLTVARDLAAKDADIAEEDRRPVIFAAAQDFEQLLVSSDEDGLLATIHAAREDRFLGWLLPNVQRDLGVRGRQQKPYPFDVGDILPWWKDIDEQRANAAVKEIGD